MPPQHQHHQPMDSSTILRELKEHNSFFDSVVDMIPATLYVTSGNSAGK